MTTREQLARIRELRRQHPSLTFEAAERVIVHGQPPPPPEPPPPTVRVAFLNAQYLGGHPALGAPGLAGSLVVTDQLIGVGRQLIGVGRYDPIRHALRMSQVATIEVESAQHAKNTTARTLAFGVLGGLSGANTKDVTNLIVHTRDGETAYYQIGKSDAMQVRAQLTPVLAAAGVPFKTDTPDAPEVIALPTMSVADELKKLADLRDAGVLTDEEFAAQKARLLNQ